MVEIIEDGDIFKSQADVLVVPVNTVGTMGNGLALAFKNRVWGLDAAYKRVCRGGQLLSRGYYIYSHPSLQGQRIMCFPTKRNWRDPSELCWIESSLLKILNDYRSLDIRSIAFPALGCGKGQLEWEDVRDLIVTYFDDTDLKVELYAPRA